MSTSELRFQHLSYEGAGLVKRPTPLIPLSNLGTVWIRGPEGTGKTTLFEVMTTVLYGRGSPRVRQEKLTESSLHNEEVGYHARLAFESGRGRNTRQVEISQNFKHPIYKSKYTIEIDGSDADCPTKKPDQKKLVAKLAPLSYDEWLGVVYLSQGGVHDLLVGTDAARQNYLTTVFGLSFYEDLLTEAKEAAKGFAGVDKNNLTIESEIRTVQEQREATKESVASEPDPDDLVAQITTLTEKMQKFAAKRAKLQALIQQQDDLRVLEKKFASQWTLTEDPAVVVEDTKTRLAEVKSSLSEARKRLSDIEKATSKSDGLRETLSALKKKEAKAAVDLDEAYPVTMTQEQLDEVLPLVEVAKRFSLESMKGKSRVDLQTAVMDVTEADTVVKALVKVQKAVGTCDNCPTCNQPLADVHTALTNAQDKAHKARLVLSATLWSSGLTMSIATVTQAQKDLLRHTKLAAALDQVVEQVANAEAALAACACPNPQERTAAQEAVDQLEAQVDGLQDTLDRARDCATLKVQIDTTRTSANLSSDADLQGDVVRLTEKLQKAKDIHDQAMAAKRRVDQATERLRHLDKQEEALNQRLEAVREKVKMSEEYASVIVPYFETLRAQRVKERVALLEVALPPYLTAMSADQYIGADLRLEVADDLSAIAVKMKTGQFNQKWVSAVQASGGQRRRFTVSVIGALREIAARAANLIAFDEPFADLQNEGKLLMINRLFPLMLDRCPGLDTVLVVAHDQEVVGSSKTAFDRIWTTSVDADGAHISLG